MSEEATGGTTPAEPPSRFPRRPRFIKTWGLRLTAWIVLAVVIVGAVTAYAISQVRHSHSLAQVHTESTWEDQVTKMGFHFDKTDPSDTVVSVDFNPGYGTVRNIQFFGCQSNYSTPPPAAWGAFSQMVQGIPDVQQGHPVGFYVLSSSASPRTSVQITVYFNHTLDQLQADSDALRVFKILAAHLPLPLTPPAEAFCFRLNYLSSACGGMLSDVATLGSPTLVVECSPARSDSGRAYNVCANSKSSQGVKGGILYHKRYTVCMSTEEALELINASEHTTYTVSNKFTGGEDQGAYRVTSPDGKNAVLKLSLNPMWVKQVERAKVATSHLSKLGYPVPIYSVVGATDRGTYWLQSEITGAPAVQPNAEQIQALLQLIEMQQGQTTSDLQGQDWVWYLQEVVFRGESGLVRMLMQFSNDTSALAAEIEGMVMGLDATPLPKTDMVHGDMGIGQVLFQGNAVAGVLDWDQVGYGDRTIDLMGLWYSIVDKPDVAEMVFKQMVSVSTPPAIKIYAAAKMLAMIAWHINKVGGDVAGVAAQARIALARLRQI